MAKFTKQAICASFINLLNSRPLDQITVKDIVEDCGVNRKTFYYYYQDIYALVDDFFSNELERIQKELPTHVNWKEAQKVLAASMLKNKTAILHVYRSRDYAKLEQTAYDVGMKTLPAFIKSQAGGADVDESDVLLIADLCSSAMSGFLARWVRDGMKTDPAAMIDRVAAIMAGTTELAVANAVRLKKKE